MLLIPKIQFNSGEKLYENFYSFDFSQFSNLYCFENKLKLF